MSNSSSVLNFMPKSCSLRVFPGKIEKKSWDSHWCKTFDKFHVLYRCCQFKFHFNILNIRDSRANRYIRFLGLTLDGPIFLEIISHIWKKPLAYHFWRDIILLCGSDVIALFPAQNIFKIQIFFFPLFEICLFSSIFSCFIFKGHCPFHCSTYLWNPILTQLSFSKPSQPHISHLTSIIIRIAVSWKDQKLFS